MQCDNIDLKARLDVMKRERLCFNCLGNHKAISPGTVTPGIVAEYATRSTTVVYVEWTA